jgi:hypothetical protein
MAQDGDLQTMLDELRDERSKALVVAKIAELRQGPDCVHGSQGGAALHPISGEPLCPMCRRAQLRLAASTA